MITNARSWHEADQVTELEVGCERKADLLQTFLFASVQDTGLFSQLYAFLAVYLQIGNRQS